MKKMFSLMLLLATILTFTACSDDDDDKDEPIDYTSKLVGTWVYEESTTNENLGVTASLESVWTFRSNKTCNWTVQSKVNGRVTNSTGIDAAYSYDGKSLKLTHDGTTEEISAVVNGNYLTIVTTEGNSMTHRKQ